MFTNGSDESPNVITTIALSIHYCFFFFKQDVLSNRIMLGHDQKYHEFLQIKIPDVHNLEGKKHIYVKFFNQRNSVYCLIVSISSRPRNILHLAN